MKFFAGIKLAPISFEESMRLVESFVQDGSYHYQISLNAGKIVAAQKDQKLLSIINQADILNADGAPIKLITQILYRSYTKLMGGLDYMDGLAIRHPEYKYYFLGSSEKAVQRTVDYYKIKYNLNVVGWRNGYYTEAEVEEIIRDINDKDTDILYVALGTPQKEYFLYDHKDLLKCKLAIGVGGAFNIIAGFQTRAPKFLQHLGLEWLYRVIQEPGRMWYRYLTGNSMFIWLTLKEIFKKNHNL